MSKLVTLYAVVESYIPALRKRILTEAGEDEGIRDLEELVSDQWELQKRGKGYDMSSMTPQEAATVERIKTAAINIAPSFMLEFNKDRKQKLKKFPAKWVRRGSVVLANLAVVAYAILTDNPMIQDAGVFLVSNAAALAAPSAAALAYTYRNPANKEFESNLKIAYYMEPNPSSSVRQSF